MVGDRGWSRIGGEEHPVNLLPSSASLTGRFVSLAKKWRTQLGSRFRVPARIRAGAERHGIASFYAASGAVLLGSILSACVATAPVTRVVGPLPEEELGIYVTAARQKEEVVRSLRAAGLRLVDAPGDGSYLLRVTIGAPQESQPCGTLNNVRYTLRYGGRTVAETEAKGWTGTCEPNVLDAASRELRLVLERNGRREP